MTRDSYLRYSGHLGAILFNIAIIGVLFIASFVILPMLWIVAAGVLLVIVIYATALSVGLVWASEGFRNFAGGYFNILFSEQLSLYVETINNYSTLAFVLTSILLVLSAVFLFFDRNNHRSKGRLIAVIVFAVIFVVLAICFGAGVTLGGVL